MSLLKKPAKQQSDIPTATFKEIIQV